MSLSNVVPLKVNYRTMDDFKQFKEYGLEELSMLEDLQENLIEDEGNSPFFGVYDGDKLVGRMSLYRINRKYDPYFIPSQDHYELFKLEVIPEYRSKGIGKQLVKYAMSLGYPIKTNARNSSDNFWTALGFKPVKYDPSRDRGENPYLWHPDGI